MMPWNIYHPKLFNVEGNFAFISIRFIAYLNVSIKKQLANLVI